MGSSIGHRYSERYPEQRLPRSAEGQLHNAKPVLGFAVLSSSDAQPCHNVFQSYSQGFREASIMIRIGSEDMYCAS
jgi:hypothetical protein